MDYGMVIFYATTAILSAIVLFAVALLAISTIENFLLKTYGATGKIESVKFTPKHTTYVPCERMYLPVFVSDNWTATITALLPNGTKFSDDFDFSSEVKVGSKVHVKYIKTLFTKKPKIIKVN
jgi:hypothetical protein